MRLRVLGPAVAAARRRPALVRLHLPVALPAAARATGTCCARAGGTRRSAAARCSTSPRCCRRRGPGPTVDVDRVVAERGWVDADELELLTGERRAPTVGRWVVARRTWSTRAAVDLRAAARRRRAARARRWRARRPRAGACSATLDGVVVDGVDGPPRRPASTRSPATGRRRARPPAGCAPPDPAGIDRAAAAGAGPPRRASSSATGCGSTPTPSTPPARSPPRCSPSIRPGSPSARSASRRDHPQARRAAAGRARRPGRHPPPGRPAHRRQPPADEPDQADPRSRRRSSWFSPPQMP